LYEVSLGTDRMSVDFGSSHTLQAIITPKRTTDRVDLEWSSDNPSVVSINEEGVLTAVNHGEASVTVNASLWGETVTCTFIVEVVPAVVNIPDEAFRNYCLDIADLNDDGILTSDETVTISDMRPRELGIKSLEGIRYFTSLGLLMCNKNELTTLDLKHNNELYEINCADNNLTSLDVSKHPELRSLVCFNNQLESINLTQNPELFLLSCSNNKLSSLDISQNATLAMLACSENQLTALDVSQNTILTFLICSANNLGPAIDVSQNPNLEFLMCENNPLLEEVWLKTGQDLTLFLLVKDDHTVIKFVD